MNKLYKNHNKCLLCKTHIKSIKPFMIKIFMSHKPLKNHLHVLKMMFTLKHEIHAHIEHMYA